MAKGAELLFLPLGGSGEIGMNFNAYGFGPASRRQWIVERNLRPDLATSCAG